MPLISIFYGISIFMYYEAGGRHHYPHIHAQHGDFIAVFTIDDGMN
jgi:hypothetical protein